MRRYKYRRLYSWSSELGYLAGLIASDGCLANNGRHIIITSKDISIIQATQDILKVKTKYRSKQGQFGTEAYHFQFSDVALYDFLLAAGITPAKSKTIRSVSVPDEFYADFLRGYFDGDGTTYGFKDSRWKNSYMFYTGFVSASYNFLIWLQKKNQTLLSTTAGKIKTNNRAFTLTYAKADSRLLFSGMYGHDPKYRLGRKYQKLGNFINTDPHGKMSSVNARVL